MSGVTIFKSITQTTGGDDFPVSDVMTAIKSGHWQTKVAYYRSLPEMTEEQIKIKKQAKKDIPYFTGSGTFDKRSDDGIKQHNGRIVLDIDGIEDIDDARSLVCGDDFVEYAFRSVGGAGLAVVVKIDPRKHLESWKALTAYFKEKYGLIVDKATKDISRARFVSYDPELWHNARSKVFKLTQYDELGKERAQKILDEAKEGEVHNALIRASRLLGGYVSGGLIEESEAEEFLLDLMSKKQGVVSLDIERKKIQDGINNGKRQPITPKEIETASKQTDEEREKWREIFAFAHEVNKHGRQYTSDDIKHICEQYLFAADKVRAVFKKVFDENSDEFGINDKPEIYKVEVWLKKNWDFAENEITQVPEFKEKDQKKFELLNADTIYRKMQHVGFKYSLDKLKSLLRSDFMYRYNPFHDYFNALPKWDGETDYISELANYVQVEDQDFFKVQFKKCLVRCIGCSLYGFENRIVFVLVGEKQSTGKSTFLRFLNPFGTKYYTEAPIHNNKDSTLALAENFIYNLEELASLSNIDVNRLKSVISTATIKERKAYAKDAVEQPRRSNFFGSTNKTEFLTDTENTRWLCFNLLSINWGYKKNLNINDVWTQAFALYNDPDFNDQLTASEAVYRDSKNKDYEINDLEKELIKRHFEICKSHEGHFYSNADILDTLQIDGGKKLESRFIGKNMVQLGFERGVKKMNGHTVRGYFCKKILGDYLTAESDGQTKIF
jgi:predicted P-loop ATPase